MYFWPAISTAIAVSSSPSSLKLACNPSFLWWAWGHFREPQRHCRLIHFEHQDISQLLLSLSSRDVIEHWLAGTLQMNTFLRIGFNWVHYQGTSLGLVVYRITLHCAPKGLALYWVVDRIQFPASHSHRGDKKSWTLVTKIISGEMEMNWTSFI